MGLSTQDRVRQLEFRIKRQGMLELEAWLAPLLPALKDAEPELIASVEALLDCEVPTLLAMQHGEIPLPEKLEHWLAR